MYAGKIMTLFGKCKSYESRSEKLEKKLSNGAKESSEKNVDKKTSKKIDCDNFIRRRKKLTIEQEYNDSPEMFTRDLEKILLGMKIRNASVEFSSLNKMMAMACFVAGNETAAIGHLIESHAVILQQHVFHRYTKTLVRKQYLSQSQESGLKPIHMNFDPRSIEGSNSLRDKLAQMPKEWYVVQVTVAYEEPCPLENNETILDRTLPLHITILPTGRDAIEPFCVTVPKPNRNEDGIRYDAMEKIVKIQRNNKANLDAFYINNKSYWKMRERQNNNMKTAVKELEYSWLREWRILLMADPSENSPLVEEIRGMIDKLIADDLSVIEISPRSRWLLRKIATGSCFLSKVEIARAVHYVLRDNDKLANNVILSIHGKIQSVNDLRTEKRMTLVMIVDECIDHVPFETMDVLMFHPVTRFPSFNIAYAMFKEHEDSITKGCKIVKITEEFGTFIVNPARNLEKMEKRLKLFVDYWLPHWKGQYGCEPSEDDFEKVLVNKDVLMYSGHGSGIQYLPGEKIERLRVRASVLLFGCSSIRLNSMGGRFPPYGVSNQYLIACSPCVLGMLWEVTDGEIDKMTARFMSDWIPSVTKKSWSNVDINKWCDGVLKFKTPRTTDSSVESTNESELLRAVARSKEVCTQYMTTAAIIVRGLPIRLE